MKKYKLDEFDGLVESPRGYLYNSDEVDTRIAELEIFTRAAGTSLANANARIAELEAQLALEAERLNWLEAMANQKGGLLLHDGSETGRTGLGLRPGLLRRTLREAIDDARRRYAPPQAKE